MCLVTRNQLLEPRARGQVPKLFCSKTRRSEGVLQEWLQPTPLNYKQDYQIWFKGASRRSWILTILRHVFRTRLHVLSFLALTRFSSLLFILVGIGFLGFTLYQTRLTTGFIGDSVSFGFGTVHAETQGRMGALWNGSPSITTLMTVHWCFYSSTVRCGLLLLYSIRKPMAIHHIYNPLPVQQPANHSAC